MALHTWLLISNFSIAIMEKIVTKVKKQKNLDGKTDNEDEDDED